MQAEPISPRSEPISPRSEPISPRSEPISPRSEPISPRSEPISPRSEVLVTIIEQMGIKDILRISLVYPELFEESMWKKLTKYHLASDWEHYSFLSDNPREKFAQIAIRKSLLKAPSITAQVWFALLNQRKDLIEILCKEHPVETRKVCLGLAREENIYFNRPMVNFAFSILGYIPTDREEDIANFKPREESYLNLTDDIRMTSLARNVHPVYSEDFLQENSNDLCFFIYSATQERNLLEKLLDRVSTEEIAPASKRNILCNLYRGNHMHLAKRFEEKHNTSLTLAVLLSCLTDYYLNTGDDRGLYFSLLTLEEQGLLCQGSYHSKIFDLELEEVATLLKRNKIFSNRVTSNLSHRLL
ncbi:hypothetical protein BQ9231_00338 [Cedratvirus lausannensis]|uniref:F-box domain-containing protein n=1 Tax=Cedratvirus lausannensis TaxID=2023205 RepID=A0A285PX66_9VIRU|nr:hypothetical protein BQ9231_00338 [Cedratvirus lausannensis]